jgi:hypothetical protein
MGTATSASDRGEAQRRHGEHDARTHHHRLVALLLHLCVRPHARPRRHRPGRHHEPSPPRIDTVRCRKPRRSTIAWSHLLSVYIRHRATILTTTGLNGYGIQESPSRGVAPLYDDQRRCSVHGIGGRSALPKMPPRETANRGGPGGVSTDDQRPRRTGAHRTGRTESTPSNRRASESAYRLSAPTRPVGWLLSRFTRATAGVTQTVAVSSDGRLLAIADG